ncbi:Hypothetical predicted protein [Mytilus galloprovincialis]|uniref:C-type lectin domain-containing protein n=2 Tax=Mytilus galloprovincialis TaxID=29158 RepID=A0A8B6GSR9_MYTGA|nr:Hypothetical predicted protein [Mytilus galloprovincialis]
MMLMQRLVIVLRLAIAFGSNHTDVPNLVISSRQSDWDTSQTLCHSLAGENVFCTENNTRKKCRPEIADFYDTSGLPETFTAWVDSFLQTSYSITFDGCYEILRDYSTRGLMKHDTVPDQNDCVMSCPSSIEDIGWMDGDCYCVIDGVFTSVSRMTALLSPIECTDEDLNRTNTVFNLFKRTKRHNLISTGCPVGSYFGQSYVILGLVYCEDPQLYYCNNSNDALGPDTWHAAVENCTSMSGRLSNRLELIAKHPTSLSRFWMNGFTMENLAFSERKIQDTLCTALTRHEGGTFRFNLLNCSLEHPSLCVQDEKVELETLSPEDWTNERSTIDASMNTHSTSEIATDEPYAKHQSASWKSVTIPSEAYELTTSNTKYNVNESTEEDSFSAGGIAIGITVVIVCIVVVIVCYRSYTRKKKLNEEKLKYRKLHAEFKSNNVESDVMITQNLRYLPSVITYPSGYNVSNLKIPDAGSVEQIGVNVTIHEENNYPGNLEEKVGQFKAPEVSVNLEKIQFSGKGSKTEFEPGKNSNESDTDKSGSEDGRYISLVISQDKADDDDDRYVSIASPHFDIDSDNFFPRDNIESKEEEIGESAFMKNGLMVADEEDENIIMGSNEENDNTEIRTKEKGASYEETDDRAPTNIQEMKDEDGGHKERAKGDHSEEDISKLRALIEDDIGEPDMTSQILRKFSVNDRIDSAIFK